MTDPIRSRFMAPVWNAIEEDRELRTQGASLWDTYDRLSCAKIVVRLVLTCFAGLGYFVARCWQSSRDADTIRPRVLRYSENGAEVYGGTAQRKQLQKELKHIIDETASQLDNELLPGNPAEREEVVEPEFQEIENLRVKGRPLHPFLSAIVKRSRNLIGNFVHDYSRFQLGERDRYTDLPPKIYVDEDRQEVIVEIARQGRLADSASLRDDKADSEKNELLARMVVRVSLVDLDVSVISVDAWKRSYQSRRKASPSLDIGPGMRIQGDRPEHEVIMSLIKEAERENALANDAFASPRSGSEGADYSQNLPQLQNAGEYPFYSALAEAYAHVLGTGRLNHEAIMSKIQTCWQALALSHDAGGDAPDAVAYQKLAGELKGWSLAGNDPGGFPQEAGRNLENDLRIASVSLGRPVVVYCDEYEDAPLRARRYNIDGTITRPGNEKELSASIADPDNDKSLLSPLFLRKQGDTWQVADWPAGATALNKEER